MALFDSINRPAPRWYRVVKKIWSNGENLFIGIWLVTGHTQDSMVLLIFKLCSSFVKDTLDSVLVDGTEYAVKGTTEALTNITGQPPEIAVANNVSPDSKLKPPDIGGK